MTMKTDAENDGAKFVPAMSLAFFYLLFISTVFVVFASYTYRSDWTAQIVSGQSQYQTLDRLLLDVQEFGILEKDLKNSRSGLISSDVKLKELKSNVEQALVALKEAKDDRLHFKTSALQSIDAAQADFSIETETALKFPPDEGEVEENQIRTALNEMISTLAGMDEADPRIEMHLSTLIRLSKVDETLKSAEQKFSKVSIEAAIEKQTSENLRAQSGEIETQLEKFAADKPVIRSAQARLKALQSSSLKLGEFLVALISTPTIFLTLIVTIAAGGLGSVVSYSRSVKRGIFRPSVTALYSGVAEGVAAAIAIFLLSGAGMLAFTQGSGAQSTVQLSPYTVSFIAFVSGFMSDEAFEKVRKAGKQIFSENDTKPDTNSS